MTKPPKAPFSIEAEKAICGSLLIKPDSIFDVQQHMASNDIHTSKHRYIFEAIEYLAQERKGIDQVSVADELNRRKQLKECGGLEYLNILYLTVPKNNNAIHYAEIIGRTAFLRRLSNAATQIGIIANADDTESLDEKRQKAESLIMEACKRIDHKDLRHIHSAISELYDDVDRKMKQELPPGVLTGYAKIDKLIQGFQKSDLIYIGARPGMGKTALMLGILKNTAEKYNKNVAFFSLEMSEIQIARRLVSIDTGINSQTLRNGKLKESDWPIFIDKSGKISTLPIWIDDSPYISVNGLRAKIRRLQMKTKIDIIGIDYVQLMQPDKKTGNRVQDFTDISSGLKRLAREFDIPVVVGCQLSRAVEKRNDKRPILSDLRETGGLEQDADIITFIYREAYYNKETLQPNMAEIDFAKNRNGPTGMIPLGFKKELAQFYELEAQPLNF